MQHDEMFSVLSCSRTANLQNDFRKKKLKNIKMHFEELFQLYTLRYFNGCLWSKYVFSLSLSLSHKYCRLGAFSTSTIDSRVTHPHPQILRHFTNCCMLGEREKMPKQFNLIWLRPVDVENAMCSSEFVIK